MKPQFADQYRSLEQWHWWFRGREEILASILNREFRGRDSLILGSVGCGPPEGLEWLRRWSSPAGQIIGVDADLRHARRVAEGPLYVAGMLEALPFRSHAFDLVLALDVLEHLEDDVAGLAETARLLKPGGLLLVTVPALPSLWGRQDIASHHVRRYTRESLAHAFEKAGLARPRTSYFNTLLFTPIAAVRWLRRICGTFENSRSDFDGARPGLWNDLLAEIFAAERHLLRLMPLPIGVSLLALHRK